MYIIQTWEYSSRPSNEEGGTLTGSNIKQALASGTSKGCLGVPFLQQLEQEFNDNTEKDISFNSTLRHQDLLNSDYAW